MTPSAGRGAPWRSSALHVAGGFLMMGGWAAFANRAHPMPAPLQAGLVQGAMTAGITFLLKRVVEAVMARIPGRRAAGVATAAAWGVSLSLLVAAHSLAGTPELWATVAVPNLVATLYAGLYALALAGR